MNYVSNFSAIFANCHSFSYPLTPSLITSRQKLFPPRMNFKTDIKANAIAKTKVTTSYYN